MALLSFSFGGFQTIHTYYLIHFIYDQLKSLFQQS